MALHKEFKISPEQEQEIASKIKALEEAGIPAHKEEINHFLDQHAEYAPQCAQMIIKLLPLPTTTISMPEFLSKNYKEEIKKALAKNPQYAGELALTQIQLKSASLFLRVVLQEKYLVQNAQYSFEIFRAMELLVKKGFIRKQSILKLKELLYQYGEHAYQFAMAIDFLSERRLLDPKTDFLSSNIMKTLLRAPAKDVLDMACGIYELCLGNIFDHDHIELLMELLLVDSKAAVDVVGCLQLLKAADHNTGMVFNPENKSRIMNHLNEIAAVWHVMWVLNYKLVLNPHNVDMIFSHTQFLKEIHAFIWKGGDQLALDQFIHELDHQVESQQKASMQITPSANADTGLTTSSGILPSSIVTTHEPSSTFNSTSSLYSSSSPAVFKASESKSGLLPKSVPTVEELNEIFGITELVTKVEKGSHFLFISFNSNVDCALYERTITEKLLEGISNPNINKLREKSTLQIPIDDAKIYDQFIQNVAKTLKKVSPPTFTYR